MSTNRAAKPGQRQADYSNVGYAGRKTGVVLKQIGARDEHGMPALDDLFSSPQKPSSPVKVKSQPNGTSKSTAAERLDSISNSPPEPSLYSSPRKSMLPKARSPIKTSIGSPRKSLNGSPTKTMGLLASPVRMGSRGQVRVEDLKDKTNTTFANNKHKRRSLEQAPKRPPAPVSAPKPYLQVPRKGVFELPSSPALRQAESTRANGRKSLEPKAAVTQRTSPRVNKSRLIKTDPAAGLSPSPRKSRRQREESTEGELFVTQDHTSPVSTNEELELPVLASRQPLQQEPSTKARGKRRLDDIEAEERSQILQKAPLPVVQLQEAEEEFEPNFVGYDDYEEDAEPDMGLYPEPEPSPIPPSKHISPAFSAQEQAPLAVSPKRSLKRQSPFQEDPQEESSQSSKRVRFSPSQKMLPSVKAVPKPATIKKPKERDANIATLFGKARSKQPADPVQIMPLPQPPLGKSRPKGRGLQIMRDDTEPEIDGARYTRSGRTSVKPVEYWRGERIIYTEPRREGGRVSLPGIKEVIRMEDGPRPTKSKSKKKNTKSQRRQPSIESEDDEVEQEWELDPGVFAGEVPSWDSVEQRGDLEYPEQVDLAIAPRGLELLTKEAQGTTFQYAKTITLPFFHSGMVDLPPGGEKKTKNSRRNHMVFWVFSGRVVIDVSGNEFSLGRGGMWQVPRGNTYSVTNPYDKPARIFFAQGCYMTEDEGEAYEEAEAEAEAGAQE